MKDKIFKICLVLIILCALVLRFKAFFSNYTMWLDECSLALSIMHRNIFGFFKPLEHVQSAQPFFMMATKLLTYIFKTNEYSLRIIPFFASIFSIPVFYIFSKKFLSKKISILLALFIFAVNYRLVYYGVEFKQYSLDVFLALLAFCIYSFFDLDKISNKKAVLAGFAAFLVFLFSLPSIFITGAFVLYHFCDFKNLNKEKTIKILLFLLPFIVLIPIYYIFVLLPSQYVMMKIYGSLWQDGFLTLNLASVVHIIRINIVYFFNQPNFTLLGAILLVTGFIMNIKNAKMSKDSMMLCLLFLCVLLASFLHVYPIKERVSLYLLPFFIILILKPLDCVSIKNKVKSAFVIMFTLLFFSSYISISYYKEFYPNILVKKGPGAEFMQILKENYKDGDVVVYNDASDSIYEFNSMRQGFSTDKFIRINLSDYGREFYLGLLNSLPKGYTYWFYYPYDYHKKTVVPFLSEWAKDKKVLKEIRGNYHCFLGVEL